MKVSIIGAGKAAKYLSKRLEFRQIEIFQIYNRSIEKGKFLANELNSEFVEKIQDLDLDIDVLIFAVNDDAIAEISSSLTFPKDILLISLSGTNDVSKLQNASNWATIWPVYSLNQTSYLQDDIPIALTKNTNVALHNILDNLVSLLSNNIFEIEIEQRKIAHIAAVIANNFVNFLNTQMFGLLEVNHIDPNLIIPIMKQTLENSLRLKSENSLTGPAIRNDKGTINLHLDLLSEQPILQKTYDNISNQIKEIYKK